jgi:DNA/RNA-binding domain of Phe-tRNA-synthetase-like protein
MPFRDFSKSQKYQSEYTDVAFGLALISGTSNPANPPGLDQAKRKRLRKMRRRETLEGISSRIEKYARFFEDFGYECPLPKHLKRTVHSGFPRYNLMVDAHFMAEMCTGILVAVTDYDRFQGKLVLDVADHGEICMGMGQRTFHTKAGEIILRDEKGIVCVLCQGADDKTKIVEESRNVLFYAYAVPGIEGRDLRDGLTVAAEIMLEFGGGTVEGIEIF